jgi:GNAT superfamily N-acetyltransferase
MISAAGERQSEADAMGTEGVCYHACRPGDDAAIVALLERVFQQAYPLPRWCWVYQRNPVEGNQTVLATCGHRVVGCAGAVALPFQVDGRFVRTVRIQDAAVDGSFRGRGLFVEIIRALSEDARRRGIGFVLTFPRPHRPASRISFDRAGYSHAGDIFAFALPVARLSGCAPAGVRVAIEPTPLFTDRDVAFITFALREFRIVNRRDLAYLRWRYHPASGRKYVVARAFAGDQQVGFAVCKYFAAGRSIDLVEWVVRGDEDVIAASLIAIARHLDPTGAATFNLWSMEHYPLHGHLVRMGFERADANTWVMSLPLSATLTGVCSDLSAYYLSMGDSDVY